MPVARGVLPSRRLLDSGVFPGVFLGVFSGVFCGIERLTVQAIGVVTACIVVFFIAHAQDRSQTIKHGDDNNQQDEVNEIDDALL